MRYITAFCVFVLLSSHGIEAQVLPSSSGGCSISASGLVSCEWLSAVTDTSLKPDHSRSSEGRITSRKAAMTKTADTVADSRPKLLVTRYILAPGAPLNPPVEGTDVLIVVMNGGELVNEKKSPKNHVNVSSGLVMLMPKEDPYLLRNIGKENLELLMIEVRK
jgi:mannose-6-phosphate isomerase-like protein (cupin superfamily)